MPQPLPAYSMDSRAAPPSFAESSFGMYPPSGEDAGYIQVNGTHDPRFGSTVPTPMPTQGFDPRFGGTMPGSTLYPRYSTSSLTLDGTYGGATATDGWQPEVYDMEPEHLPNVFIASPLDFSGINNNGMSSSFSTVNPVSAQNPYSSNGKVELPAAEADTTEVVDNGLSAEEQEQLEKLLARQNVENAPEPFPEAQPDARRDSYNSKQFSGTGKRWTPPKLADSTVQGGFLVTGSSKKRMSVTNLLEKYQPAAPAFENVNRHTLVEPPKPVEAPPPAVVETAPPANDKPPVDPNQCTYLGKDFK